MRDLRQNCAGADGAPASVCVCVCAGVCVQACVRVRVCVCAAPCTGLSSWKKTCAYVKRDLYM